MDMNDLKKFLLASNRAGYAGGEEEKWIKEADGSTTIPFAEGDWRSHDNFFGGEPYGGRVIVFYGGKPVWIMVYYGRVEEGVQPDPIYSLLRDALKAMPEDYPLRGPKELKKESWTYQNSWQGDIDNYSGEETIADNGKIVYRAHYMGGWVDKRGGV